MRSAKAPAMSAGVMIGEGRLVHQEDVLRHRLGELVDAVHARPRRKRATAMPMTPLTSPPSVKAERVADHEPQHRHQGGDGEGSARRSPARSSCAPCRRRTAPGPGWSSSAPAPWRPAARRCRRYRWWACRRRRRQRRRNERRSRTPAARRCAEPSSALSLPCRLSCSLSSGSLSVCSYSLERVGSRSRRCGCAAPARPA